MKKLIPERKEVFFLAAIVLLWVSFQPLFAQQQMTVVIQKIRSDKGVIRLTLFTKEADYMKIFSIGKAVPAKKNELSITFDNLPAGQYAITVLHDENDNGKLDSNFFGIPKEGVGFSNNASATFGPPSWEKAKFKLEDSKPRAIALKYF